MSSFEPAIDALLLQEGEGFVEDDNGRGPCKWGVSLATAKGCGLPWTRDDIYNLTRAQAAVFYRLHYWEGGHVNLLTDQSVATKVLDLLVNVGPIAIKWLQSACDVCEDTNLGPQTAAAANAMDPATLLANMRARGEHYYQALAAKDPAKYERFLSGWLKRLSK